MHKHYVINGISYFTKSRSKMCSAMKNTWCNMYRSQVLIICFNQIQQSTRNCFNICIVSETKTGICAQHASYRIRCINTTETVHRWPLSVSNRFEFTAWPVLVSNSLSAKWFSLISVKLIECIRLQTFSTTNPHPAISLILYQIAITDNMKTK